MLLQFASPNAFCFIHVNECIQQDKCWNWSLCNLLHSQAACPLLSIMYLRTVFIAPVLNYRLLLLEIVGPSSALINTSNCTNISLQNRRGPYKGVWEVKHSELNFVHIFHMICLLCFSFVIRFLIHDIFVSISALIKAKAIPLQAWTGPEGSTRLRFPDFKTIGTWRWQGCQPYAPAVFTPRKYSRYSFLLEAESTPGP